MPNVDRKILSKVATILNKISKSCVYLANCGLLKVPGKVNILQRSSTYFDSVWLIFLKFTCLFISYRSVWVLFFGSVQNVGGVVIDVGYLLALSHQSVKVRTARYG